MCGEGGGHPRTLILRSEAFVLTRPYRRTAAGLDIGRGEENSKKREIHTAVFRGHPK